MRCLTALERAEGRLNVFNLGTDEYCEVNDSAGWIMCAARPVTAVHLFRRRARLGRRQPIHFARHEAHSCARLAAEIVD